MSEIETSRFKVKLTDLGSCVSFESNGKVLRIGVDNEGRTYIATIVRPITITPCASNRIIVEEQS